MRTEHGEYWIEPSNEVPTDKSEPRPHVIFKRSAVDKVKAFHRNKREIDHRRNTNTHVDRNINSKENPYKKRQQLNARRNRENKDRQRRLFLEQRRKRMQLLRQNPTEYRKHQAILRMEGRRLHSNSRSNSIESSRSSDQSSSLEARRRNRNRLASDEQRRRRISDRRRRRKRAQNCATKQPSYLWTKQNRQRRENKVQYLYK